MNEISKTGYWNGETAHHHHVHSEQLSKWICEFIVKKDIDSVTDFGCGLGEYLKALSPLVNHAIGVEGSIPNEKKYDNICELDLTTDLTDYEVDLTSHLVISLEVGEHIPKEHMATYLDNVTYHGTQYLITSWAVRGQEGFGHVNCLDNHEIIPEFEKRGFELMEKETEDARSVIEDKAHWFKKTILIFKIK
jgi:cyclopropane fatty-acyl-phospholipid synthase-like methyltransferase